MSRTVNASIVAGLIGCVAVGGLGMFLGFDATGSWITGAVFGILSGLLIWGAARRADSFHPDETPDAGSSATRRRSTTRPPDRPGSSGV